MVKKALFLLKFFGCKKLIRFRILYLNFKIFARNMKHNKYIFFISAFLMGALLSACSDYSSSADEKFSASVVCPENMRGSFTDSRDGQEYKFTTIGNQVWMAENLKFDDGSLCVEDSCSPKGRIYGMNPALASCPTGWHLPSKDEWFELFNNVGGIDSAGIRLKATKSGPAF